MINALKRYAVAMAVGAVLAILVAEWWRKTYYGDTYLPAAPGPPAEPADSESPAPRAGRVKQMGSRLLEPIVAVAESQAARFRTARTHVPELLGASAVVPPPEQPSNADPTAADP